MVQDVRRLQVLNDLVAQTLDVINQRAALGGGLSHAPYVLDPRLSQFGPTLGQGLPVGQAVAFTPGIIPGINPLIGYQSFGYPQQAPFIGGTFYGGVQGLSHSPYGMGVDPRVVSQTPFVAPWPQTLGFGLSHTPYGAVDPRLVTQQMGFGYSFPFTQGLGIGNQTVGFGGLSHTPYGVGTIDPRVASGIGTAGIGQGFTPQVAGWGQVGFGNTAFDPRWSGISLQPIGGYPVSGFGYPLTW